MRTLIDIGKIDMVALRPDRLTPLVTKYSVTSDATLSHVCSPAVDVPRNMYA